MGVDQDGEVKVQQFGGEFYMKYYLNKNNFSYNKSLYAWLAPKSGAD
jgi:hypothetical protein